MSLFDKVTAVEGIGESRSKDLKKAGVETQLDLLTASPEDLLARGVKASLETLGRWQSQIDLERVKRVDAQIAEAFVDAGIDSVNELSRTTLERVLKACQTAKKDSKLSSVPDESELAGIIRDAAHLRYHATVCGQVFGYDGSSTLSGQKVTSGRQSVETDESGRFCLVVESGGKTNVRIGNIPFILYLERGEVTGPVDFFLEMETETLDDETIDERNGDLVAFDGDSELHFHEVKLSEIPDGDLLRVANVTSDENRLLINLTRRSDSSGLHIDQVTLPKSWFANPPELHTILEKHGEKLVPVDEDLKSILTQRIQKALGGVELTEGEVVTMPS